jgi:hypothetical protein
MDVNSIMTEVNDVKEQIDEAKQDRAELKGRIAEQMKALKLLGASSIKEAKKLVDKETKKMEGLEKDIQKQFQKLKESYEW